MVNLFFLPIFSFLTFLLISSVFYLFYSQLFLLGSMVFFAFYWTNSIFIYLFKHDVYVKFTSVIQRFWKRTLYLFWSIELFLFFIYSWLILISPSEVEWLLDQVQLYKNSYIKGVSLHSQILSVQAVLIIAVIAQYFLHSQKNTVINIILLVLLFNVLLNDGSQTIITSMFYNNFDVVFNKSNSIWVIGSDDLKLRTNKHYVWLVVILKFWHTLFIVFFFLVSVMFIIQVGKTYHGIYASCIQNFTFLYFFSFIMYYFLYKNYVNVYFEYVFNWFFINKFH